MSNEQHTLLDELITFLENEREMYGPFSVKVGVKSKRTLTVPDEKRTACLEHSHRFD